MAGSGTIQRFEDLLAWQKARHLTKSVYQITTAGTLGNDYGLARQLQRAAVSIMSNIAEGYERNSPADFHRFLMIAKGSCAEVRSQLYIALDVAYIDQPTFQTVFNQAEETARLIGGLARSVRKRQST